MTKASTTAAIRRGAHFSVWRAVGAAPAMIGSWALLLVLTSWAGRWQPVLLLGWLASAVCVLTPAGERVMVRVGLGFRRPRREECALLAPAWGTALRRCGYRAEDVELYVQRNRNANAFASGGRSVAVTTGVLAAVQARRLTDDNLAALLAHELGHHATRATRLASCTQWLSSPWRVAVRGVLGVGLAMVGRRQPRWLLVPVVCAAVTIAIVQAVHIRHWTSAVVLVCLAAGTVLCPLADAAISRRGEYAADHCASAAGFGRQLADALRILAPAAPRRPGLIARMLDRHPPVQNRIAALER